jgi:hypothetical protein
VPFATAGEVTSASALRDTLGTIGVLQNDISVTSLDTFVDCPGLTVSLDGFAIYEIDGYIAYSSATAADLQVSLVGPTDATGNASFFGQDDTATGGVGPVNAFRFNTFDGTGFTTTAGAGAGSPMAAMPHGRIRTFRFGGAVQLRFCQGTSTASATVVHAGSWLRASKIANQSIG